MAPWQRCSGGGAGGECIGCNSLGGGRTRARKGWSTAALTACARIVQILCPPHPGVTMAINAHLFLKIAGADAKGESTQKDDGGIECHNVSFGVSNPIDWSTGAASGRREYQAISIQKRVDKLTPLLYKALTTNQTVEGKIKFWRPPADGGAVDEQFFTVEFKYGRVESISDSSGSDHPAESVTFAYRAITITYDSKAAKGVTHSDDWSKA
jgi:type VI secretion system secreted protein Hcp